VGILLNFACTIIKLL